MNKALEITIYTASGLAIVVLTNAIVKQLNDGVGIFTTDRRMAKYAMTKPSGNFTPTTDATWKKHYAWWKSEPKGFRKAWYKSVWRAEHGNKNKDANQTFEYGGKTYWVKGAEEKK
jgi:hypothetical protein